MPRPIFMGLSYRCPPHFVHEMPGSRTLRSPRAGNRWYSQTPEAPQRPRDSIRKKRSAQSGPPIHRTDPRRLRFISPALSRRQIPPSRHPPAPARAAEDIPYSPPDDTPCSSPTVPYKRPKIWSYRSTSPPHPDPSVSSAPAHPESPADPPRAPRDPSAPESPAPPISDAIASHRNKTAPAANSPPGPQTTNCSSDCSRPTSRATDPSPSP